MGGKSSGKVSTCLLLGRLLRKSFPDLSAPWWNTMGSFSRALLLGLWITKNEWHRGQGVRYWKIPKVPWSVFARCLYDRFGTLIYARRQGVSICLSKKDMEKVPDVACNMKGSYVKEWLVKVRLIFGCSLSSFSTCCRIAGPKSSFGVIVALL